jgi:hypothetical protein
MQDVKQTPPTHNRTNPKTQPNPKKQLKNQPKICAVQNTHNHTTKKLTTFIYQYDKNMKSMLNEVLKGAISL